MTATVFPTPPTLTPQNARRAAFSPNLARRLLLLGAAALAAAASAPAAVVDVSGIYTNNPTATIGASNIANLTGDTSFNFWGSNHCPIPVITNGYLFTLDSGGGNAVNYTGDISGEGGLQVKAYSLTSPTRIGGSVGNTYTGATVVNSGRVNLEKSTGSALCGSITLNSSSKLLWIAANQISDTSNVTLTSTASLDLAGFTDTINELYLVTGNSVQTGAGGVLKVAKLFLNGTQQPDVAYIAGDGFVLGSGYIEVGASGPPVIVSAPDAPATPTPADLAATVHPALLTKLDWSDSALATSYDVYLWLASDTKPVTPTATDAPLSEYTVSPQVLSLENYKWQVVAKNTLGNTDGPEWTFSTMDRKDISGTLTDTLDNIVGAGGTARLIADTTSHWGWETSADNINLNSFQFNIVTGGGNGHVYNGAITGPGSIRFEGRGDASWFPDMQLGGTTANSMANATLVAGRLQLNKTAGVDALAGAITVATTQTVHIQLLKSDQINDAAMIDSTTSGGAFVLELGGFTETLAGLTIKTGHSVATGTGGVLTVTDLTVGGAVMPPGTYTSASGFVTGSGSVVVPGATTPADAATSTVAAAPSSVVADGSTTATITVTLLDASSAAVHGKTVTLASSRAPGTDTISAASGSSNASGVVTFSVKSTTVGTPVFTATDTTDGVTVSATATVTFTAATHVVDISNVTTPGEPANPGAGVDINTTVGAGKTGRLIGLTQTVWWGGGFLRDLDLNGNTLIIDSGGGNACAASGAISGNGLVRVNAGGIGIIHLNGSVGNTYTGTTEINNGPVKLGKTTGNALNGTITVNGQMSNSFPGTGTVLWGANNQINDASNLTLTAGSSLNFNGYSDTLGTLALTGDANIYLSGATSIARFADSSAAPWTAGKQLVIREWNGSPTGGGTAGVFFGSSASGLSAGQIANTGFMNPASLATGLYHATILATGEVVPSGSAVVPVSPPYDLSPAATAARTAIYTSTGRAALTAAGTPLATGTRIVFFGDSITWQNSYISMLDAAITAGAGTQGKTIILINRGINGGTTVNIRDGAASGGYPGSVAQASFSSLLTSDQATIAVVFIGINDIWWAGTTATAYEQGLRDLAATAAAQGVKLIFATPAAHDESPVGAGTDDARINQFSGIVQSVAASTGATFVDLRSAFVAYWQNNNYEIRLDGGFVTLKPYGLLTYDGVHPTDLGNQMIADQMAGGILASYTVGSAFDTWAGTGGKGLTGAAAAFDADPDLDGISNGIEFVIGGEPNPANPGSNSAALLPTAVASGNNLVFTFTRTHEAAYLNPVVEFDADLQGAWTTVTSGNATIAVTPGTTADTVTVTIPKGANQKLFARLKVVNTP